MDGRTSQSVSLVCLDKVESRLAEDGKSGDKKKIQREKWRSSVVAVVPVVDDDERQPSQNKAKSLCETTHTHTHSPALTRFHEKTTELRKDAFDECVRCSGSHILLSICPYIPMFVSSSIWMEGWRLGGACDRWMGECVCRVRKRERK